MYHIGPKRRQQSAKAPARGQAVTSPGRESPVCASGPCWSWWDWRLLDNLQHRHLPCAWSIKRGRGKSESGSVVAVAVVILVVVVTVVVVAVAVVLVLLPVVVLVIVFVIVRRRRGQCRRS